MVAGFPVAPNSSVLSSPEWLFFPLALPIGSVIRLLQQWVVRKISGRKFLIPLWMAHFRLRSAVVISPYQHTAERTPATGGSDSIGSVTA